MKAIQLSIATMALAICLTSCDGWIDNAKTPNNMITAEQIVRPSMLATIRTKEVKDCQRENIGRRGRFGSIPHIRSNDR